MSDGEELDEDLLEVVLAEAGESLESALWTLRAVGHGPQGPEVVASLFRCFHSIKGNTAMAGRVEVSRFAHRIESALDTVREANRALVVDEAKLLIEAVDLLHPMLDGGSQEELEPARAQLAKCLDRLEQLLGGASGPGGATAAADPAVSGVAAAPEVEEAASAAGASASQSGDGGGGGAKLRVDAQSIVDAMTVAGELFHADERLKFFVHGAVGRLDSESWGALTQLSREFDGAIEKLYEQLLDIQRLSVGQLTNPLERNVRDICRKTGKEIEFRVRGQELRIDKNVIQTLKDPLMHMVRNAADHGVERPEARASAGKNRSATVSLEFCDREDVVEVVLSDDGGGIDHNRVREKAVEKGLLAREAADALSTQELVEMIFHPGFSTAEQVSELSGRGVGMDVVAREIAASGGTIETRTELGKGSTFFISVPKASSPVVDGLAVSSGDTIYLLPVRNVLTFVARSELRVITQPSGAVCAFFQGRAYKLCHLPGQGDVARLRRIRTIGVLIEDRRGNRGILIVDEVLGRRKALTESIKYRPCIRERATSVAVLGDGKLGFSVPVEEYLKPSLLMNNLEQLSLDGEQESTMESSTCTS